MMTDDAEWKAIEAKLGALKSLYNRIAGGGNPFKWRPIAIDVPLPLLVDDVGFGSITTDAGSTFYVKSVEAHYRVSGTLDEGSGSPATLTIPETLRPLIMDYTWNIRDESTNRDWGNRPIPSSVFRSGNMNAMEFLGGHARLKGGTQVTATVNVTAFDSASAITGLSDFNGHSLQIVLCGIEIKDGIL